MKEQLLSNFCILSCPFPYALILPFFFQLELKKLHSPLPLEVRAGPLLEVSEWSGAVGRGFWGCTRWRPMYSSFLNIDSSLLLMKIFERLYYCVFCIIFTFFITFVLIIVIK